MKIGVCAKVTIDADARVAVADGKKSVSRDGVKLGISDYDEFAIEEAIRTKEKHEGEVVSFTVGDTAHLKQLRSGALALGVDKAVLISDGPSDPFGVATVLAESIKKEGCEVVFTGKSTIDGQNFQVAVMIAELLNWAHVTQVTELSIDGNSFKATRAMDAGIRHIVTGTLPAVISCEDGLNTVRYAKLPAIMKAKRKPTDKLTGADFTTPATGIDVSNLAPPPARPAGHMIAGDAATAAKELVRLLRDEAKVL